MATDRSGQGEVGFVGLGVMGLPMATHLVDAGFTVHCANRSPGAVERLTTRGAHEAADLIQLGAASRVVITMLPAGADVSQVLLGEAGVARGMAPGSLVVDCSTIAPSEAVSIAAKLGELGVRFVDAPVSGGEAGALAGTLAVMAGGDPTAVGDAEPVLSSFASVLKHVGPVGSGQLVKAANQMIVAGNLAVLAEALLLLDRSGVDAATALTVLNGGLASSRCLEAKGPAMLARDFRPGFRVDLHHKDLMIALAATEEARVAAPVTGLVTQLLRSLRASGQGDLDHGALMDVVERLTHPSPVDSATRRS